ncbi:unnamed protein product [Orchesella dallaii]|uniref:Uncharacterized protein n=1 Tax=Orchesella dallaii TaxID=48710 RepID=A0ABP1PXR9_9HEXA
MDQKHLAASASEQSQTLSSQLSSSPTKQTVKKKVQFMDAPMLSPPSQRGDNDTNKTCLDVDNMNVNFNLLRLSVDGVKEKEEGNSKLKEGREKGWNSYQFSLEKEKKEKRKRVDDAATIEKEDRSKIVKLQKH